MGSFYGQVSLGGSGSGGGVSNYNDLSNKPIKNLTGLTAINLSSLEEGLYNIKGNYIYNTSDTTVKTFASPRLLQVLLDDSVTDAKNIIFEYFNNGRHFAKIIHSYADGTYTEENYAYDHTISAENKSELPEIGDPSMLYSTSEGVFVWSEDAQEYVQLGSTEASGGQNWDAM